jgi:indole-3-glycerol phosphate synthase
MKDFVVSTDQIDAASRFGADAVLLIQALFDREYCDQDKMIQHAHSLGLEVLLEAYSEDEFKEVVESNADMIGINNRDLRTFIVSLNNTVQILKKSNIRDRIVVSESGVESPRDLLFLKDAGARAFLVGTSIMSSHNVEEKVRELTEA